MVYLKFKVSVTKTLTGPYDEIGTFSDEQPDALETALEHARWELEAVARGKPFREPGCLKIEFFPLTWRG